jgi:cysteine-rich repeat protein
MKRFAFVISFICFLAFSSSTFSQFAFADDKKVIKKRKKVSIEKTDGKITIKKTLKKRKKDNDKDSDKGDKGVPKQIRKLDAKVNALQQQVDTIELTPGPPGTPGTNGEDGAPGTPGLNGKDGAPGSDGVDGDDGAKGDTGTPGTDGDKGETGEQGIQGEKGDTGDAGVKGDIGEQGLKGNTGDTGATGQAGATGATGGTGAKGDTGEAGPSGAEISGQLDPCGPNGGLGIIAHIPGRSFSVRLPFDGSFVFSHIPEGTHTIAFELNGVVIGMLPNVTTVEGQTTDVGVFVTPFCSGDADGDGVTGSQGDCDNNNASVFPGATEICDGIDNNCDTVIDGGGVCTTDPVDCEVSDFGAFSACSGACGGGGGTATRTRTVLVQPANGGEACPALTEDQACNTQPCPVDCQLSEWSLSDCSATCGEGTQTRTRTIIQEPQFGGAACGPLMESSVCSGPPCVECTDQEQQGLLTCLAPCGNDESSCISNCTSGLSSTCQTAMAKLESCAGFITCEGSGFISSCTYQVCSSATLPPSNNSVWFDVFQYFVPDCSANEIECNGVCVFNDSNANCGACGNVCESHESCVNGGCQRGNAYCGDFIVDAHLGEFCDNGPENFETAECDSGDCSEVICGDGYRNSSAAEQCDDGNTNNGDGCSSTCQVE